MVEVVNVNVFPAEVDERLLALVADVGGFVGVGGGSGEVANFSGDYVVGGVEPELVESALEHAFGFAVSVNVGVIEVVDSGVDARFDGGNDFILVDVGPSIGVSVDPIESSHRPTSEADFRNFDA